MKKILLLVLAGVVVSAVLITVSGHPGMWNPIEEKAKPAAPVQGKRDQRLEVELVDITPDGFEPQQIERPAGPFILSISNRSGIDSLNIRIDTEQHGRFRDKSLPLLTPYWREVINPPPGKYVITEDNHPEWTLTFTIN